MSRVEKSGVRDPWCKSTQWTTRICRAPGVFSLQLIATLAMPLVAQAELPPAAPFEARTYQAADGEKLPYLLLRPKDFDPASGKKCPLLVFLHGAGERGDNNRAQIVHGRPFFLNAAEKYGALVVAPQCPNNAQWVDVPWSAPRHTAPKAPSKPMKRLLELLDQLRKEYPIDADRNYVMGLSMGGFGTWDMIQRDPDRYAAAVPICGGGDTDLAARLAKLPVWVYHGAKDGVVMTSRSRDMVEAIRKAGGTPKYSELPSIGHNAWSIAFNDPELPGWLFAQKRGQK